MNQQTKPDRSVGVPTLGRVGDVKLSQVPTLADCAPGFKPTEYNVVIAPATMPDKVGSLILPQETRDKMSDAQQVGRIIALSPVAFNYERWPDGAEPPRVGDIVWFARYAGAQFEGMDGKQYRIVKDKDLSGVLEDGI